MWYTRAQISKTKTFISLINYPDYRCTPLAFPNPFLGESNKLNDSATLLLVVGCYSHLQDFHSLKVDFSVRRRNKREREDWQNEWENVVHVGRARKPGDDSDGRPEEDRRRRHARPTLQRCGRETGGGLK